MNIPCKSCGNPLSIPDDANELTVRCPVCQKEFAYTAEAKVNENENNSAKPSSQIIERRTPPAIVMPFPEFATRESYHHSRDLYLDAFCSMEVPLSLFHIILKHKFVFILLALLVPIPFLLHEFSQATVAPEYIEEIMDTFGKKGLPETFQFDDIKHWLQISADCQTHKFFFNFFIWLTLSVFIGGIRMFNAYGRNQKVSFWLIFSGFDSPLRVLITHIIFLCQIVMVVIPVFVGIIYNGEMVRLLSFLSFLLGLLFFVGSFFVLPLIADTDISVLKAFRLSFKMGLRNFFTIIGIFMLLFYGITAYSYFVAIIFNSFLSQFHQSIIALALFEPILMGFLSITYLKATGHFRD